MAGVSGAPVDRMLRPVHRWVWGNFDRRVRKLLAFAEVEGDGGRDILRAAELTADPLLRRLYLAHAADELRHGEMFRRRGSEILRALQARSTSGFQADWLAPSGHGVDDLNVDGTDDTLLAFLHLSEKAAATRFAVYRDVLQDDLPTQKIFEAILRDEAFHMNYAFSQLARVSPQHHWRRLWRARLSRLWKAYLRLAAALGGIMGALILTIQYFVLLPPFAWLAKRAARREPPGWTPISPSRNGSLNRQY
ncbi:MAG: rubrerythrin family protein [Acidobacteria bacterium]|nr:MAG: rubrerythrin family protein [Acidobacteriota bacterium]